MWRVWSVSFRRLSRGGWSGRNLAWLKQLRISWAMNLRQTQRVLADLVARCQDAHVQLPVDPFDGMLSAAEALRHTRVGGKVKVEDALEELKQRYGLEPKWQQIEDASEARQHSESRKRLRRGDHDSSSVNQDESSVNFESASSVASTDRRRVKKAKLSSPSIHGSSTIDRIIENNPARNPRNEELAEEFVEIGGYEITHGEKQKGISRMAVAKQIRQAKEPITSGDQARVLPHVGPSAAAKIDEVLSRGKMKALEAYEEEKRHEEASASPRDDEEDEDEGDDYEEESEGTEAEWREEDGSGDE